MKRRSFMVIAGETSGDMLAAELVLELKRRLAEAESRPTGDSQPLLASLEPRFFGAGGPHMAAAGVELAMDLTAHAAVGLPLGHYFKFRRFFYRQLLQQAIERQPDVIIGVDYGFWNLGVARAIQSYVGRHSRWLSDWRPKIVQFVSPQVWASRPGRADRMARDHDLVLSIFPFEKAWYAQRVPNLRVEFVGHPMVDRYAAIAECGVRSAEVESGSAGALGEERESGAASASPRVLLLPGSRAGGVRRHLPPMIRALALMRASLPELRARMVLPNPALAQQAREMGLPAYLEMQIGNLPQALLETDVAIISTGTVTMECAYFGVPAVAMFKTAQVAYAIGKRLATVQWMAMPNIMAKEVVFPEFIQQAATPQNLAAAAMELLRDEKRRAWVKGRLAQIVQTLGQPGAAGRAAQAIVELLEGTGD